MAVIAFATYQGSPEMTDDDRLVADALRQYNVSVTSAVWDAPDIDWSRFDCVVIRSTWDYHDKANHYEQWLRSFPGTASRLWNPPHVVRENMNKRYLIDLANRGLDVVPTTYQPAAEGLVLQEVLQSCGWEDVVIKPAVSACAQGAWRTSLATADTDQARFTEQVRSHDILIQPYVSEVASQGEWSLIFFDGRYSHAALKRPAKGDYRVQREYGGNSVSAEASPKMIEQAQSLLSVIDDPLLYARVDGFERAGRFVLMELEINEPFLFISYSAGAAQRFAEAIIQKLTTTRLHR